MARVDTTRRLNFPLLSSEAIPADRENFSTVREPMRGGDGRNGDDATPTPVEMHPSLGLAPPPTVTALRQHGSCRQKLSPISPRSSFSSPPLLPLLLSQALTTCRYLRRTSLVNLRGELDFNALPISSRRTAYSTSAPFGSWES